MASGKESSINNEIAGKITSAVRGVLEKTEAVAKELNATITMTNQPEDTTST